jgi:hypothetical protein
MNDFYCAVRSAVHVICRLGPLSIYIMRKWRRKRKGKVRSYLCSAVVDSVISVNLENKSDR